MNKHILLGNLTADPEPIKALEINGKMRNVTRFTLAVNDTKDKSTYYRVTSFDALADNVVNNLCKGRKVLVEANSMRAKAYTTKAGEMRADLECVASSIDFCGPRRAEADDNQFSAVPADSESARKAAAISAAHAAIEVEDEQLPF